MSKIVTIQKTSKDAKVLKAIGWCMVLGGLVVQFGYHEQLGSVVFVFGFPVLFVARCMKWWQND
jgi:cell shape-determining protein MreD